MSLVNISVGYKSEISQKNINVGSPEGIHQAGNADEHPEFQKAQKKANQLSKAGQIEEASRPFMDALEHVESLERERQEIGKRLRLKLLEESVVFDKRASNADAVCTKLQRIAEIVHPGDRKAQETYLEGRAEEYNRLGTVKGDNPALLIAVSVFRLLAKGAKNGGR